jgi:hypothetical protein
LNLFGIEYDDTSVPTELADHARLTVPPPARSNRVLPAKKPRRYEGLEKAGFKRKQTGTGGSFRGRYVDVGASAKGLVSKVSSALADIRVCAFQSHNHRQIKVKSGSCPVAYTETGLAFDDRTHLDADVIVFATGYELNMLDIVQDLFGPDMRSLVDKPWGLSGEDELNGAYRPTDRKFTASSAWVIFSFPIGFLPLTVHG